MYKTEKITENMVNSLKTKDKKLYDQYMRMTKRGIEFSVAQFFRFFSDRGIGKSFMMWINALDSFMMNDYETERFFETEKDVELVVRIIDEYFKDIKILKKSKGRILIEKI